MTDSRDMPYPNAPGGPPSRRTRWLGGLSALFLGAAVLVSAGPGARAEKNGNAHAGESEAHAHPVTPVSGPSWLRHLGLPISETHMGQMGGTGSPPSSLRREPSAAGGQTGINLAMRHFLAFFRSNSGRADRAFNTPFKLTGADLYRLNCQSCHGPDGRGAPPEIKSLIGPVRGTSVAAIQARMKKKGIPIDAGMAGQLAAQAEAALRERLAKGGKKMPAFRHLRGDEIEALLGYLQKLAGVPSAGRDTMLVTQSVARVGEHVVKGTCHVCHDATGPGGGRMAMMRGIIPSLASIPQEQSLSSVLRQVEYGSAGRMMMMMRTQRMPALPYLTQEEVAAAYFYLAKYPPQP